MTHGASLHNRPPTQITSQSIFSHDLVMYISNFNEIFTHAKFDLVTPQTVMPCIQGPLAIFIANFLHLFPSNIGIASHPSCQQSFWTFATSGVKWCSMFSALVSLLCTIANFGVPHLLFSGSQQKTMFHFIFPSCTSSRKFSATNSSLLILRSFPLAASIWIWCFHRLLTMDSLVGCCLDDELVLFPFHPLSRSQT